MPHISVKMLETLTTELHYPSNNVTNKIKDYSAAEWQKVFKEEISDKPADKVFKKAEYDPKDLL